MKRHAQRNADAWRFKLLISLQKIRVDLMRMLNLPLFHLDSDPETIDTNGNDRQQEPLDPIAEQLYRGSVK